jgi:hypothetical protein
MDPQHKSSPYSRDYTDAWYYLLVWKFHTLLKSYVYVKLEIKFSQKRCQWAQLITYKYKLFKET